MIRLIRRLFTINNLLLFSAIFALWFSLSSFVQAIDSFNHLVPHYGMLKEKKLVRGDRVKKALRVSLYDGQTFYASVNTRYLDSLLWQDDSLVIYTKPPGSLFENQITSLSGDTVQASEYDQEIFHVVRTADGSVLLDYQLQLRNLRRSAWLGPIVAATLLFFYFMRRSPIGSRMIISRKTISI